MFYSPLRYPGGKGKLASLIASAIHATGHYRCTYVEPFAGGAGVALELLEKGVVKEIVLNDYDKGVYAFWKAMLSETEHFIKDIREVPLTIEEWYRQRKIKETSNAYSYELGFATFYLNRVNRSGIIKGGVIGGIKQDGSWKMDARFNRETLVKRILQVVSKKDCIHIYNEDIVSFIKNILPEYESNAFVYFDPPYFLKGKQLYDSYFSIEDHKRFADAVKGITCDFIITYDNASEIIELYNDYNIKEFSLNYSVTTAKKGRELMISNLPPAAFMHADADSKIV